MLAHQLIHFFAAHGYHLLAPAGGLREIGSFPGPDFFHRFFGLTAGQSRLLWAYGHSAIISTSFLQMLSKTRRRFGAAALKVGLHTLYKPNGIRQLDPTKTHGPATDHVRTVEPDEATSLHLYVLNDARLYTDCFDAIAVIDSEDRLIAGASWQYVNRNQGDDPRANNVFRTGVRSIPRNYDATVFSLLTGGGGNDNYYHWLYDAIARVHLLRLTGLDKTVDYYLVPALTYSFQRQSLICLGIDREKIISSLDTPHVKARKLIVSDHPRPLHSDINPQVPGWVCQFLRDSFLETRVPAPLPSDKIYISRKDSMKGRRIVNESDVMEALTGKGFATICLSEFSFPQQVSIFANASVIVSGHGAGLTNLTFCRPGTRVVEMFNETFQYGCYENISKQVNLDYRSLLSVNADTPTTHPNMRDIVVDIPRLMRELAD